jgi:ABC-type sugar transport system permease subunit
MLLSLAGLSAVPKHLYEAAAIDRAGPFYTFFRITLPLVAPILMIAHHLPHHGSLQDLRPGLHPDQPADDGR